MLEWQSEATSLTQRAHAAAAAAEWNFFPTFQQVSSHPPGLIPWQLEEKSLPDTSQAFSIWTKTLTQRHPPVFSWGVHFRINGPDNLCRPRRHGNAVVGFFARKICSFVLWCIGAAAGIHLSTSSAPMLRKTPAVTTANKHTVCFGVRESPPPSPQPPPPPPAPAHTHSVYSLLFRPVFISPWLKVKKIVIAVG